MIKIDKHSIGNFEKRVFIIAEIGQNHQGSIEIAKKLILEAKNAGCDCVKFQKSNLNAKFTRSALERSYINENSWGNTYRMHKEYLEFSLAEMKELQRFADSLGLCFSASAMDMVSLIELSTLLHVPFIKVGSGDANNFPMLKIAAKLPIPLIISTGMQHISTIDEIYKIMNENGKTDFCLLHCVSSYPTAPKNVNLLQIVALQKRYPNIIVGYSGHEEGILISQASVLLGAKIIERHLTLDKSSKGTDHRCSLIPSEFQALVRSVRLLEEKNYTIINNPYSIEQIFHILKEIYDDGQFVNEMTALKIALKEIGTRTILKCEQLCRMKLGKSLVYSSNLEADHILREEDISIKVSEPFGITAERIYEFIGKKLHKNCSFDDPLSEFDFTP